jgi:hypothetical protein
MGTGIRVAIVGARGVVRAHRVRIVGACRVAIVGARGVAIAVRVRARPGVVVCVAGRVVVFVVVFAPCHLVVGLSPIVADRRSLAGGWRNDRLFLVLSQGQRNPATPNTIPTTSTTALRDGVMVALLSLAFPLRPPPGGLAPSSGLLSANPAYGTAAIVETIAAFLAAVFRSTTRRLSRYGVSAQRIKEQMMQGVAVPRP